MQPNNREEEGGFTVAIIILLVVIFVFGLMIGWNVGYRDGQNSERDKAIEAGVGKYKVVDNRGATEFVYGSSQEPQAESTK